MPLCHPVGVAQTLRTFQIFGVSLVLLLYSSMGKENDPVVVEKAVDAHLALLDREDAYFFVPKFLLTAWLTLVSDVLNEPN